MSKLDDENFISLLSNSFFFWVDARIGATGDVFGLGTPLDHPPETTQWVTAWVGGILYIIYK